MTERFPFVADRVDAEILQALQVQGRQSVAELARTVNMSHSATAERVRRLEESHVIGDDCFIMKVVATNMKYLEQITGRLGGLGGVTTNVVCSSALPPRPLLPPQE